MSLFDDIGRKVTDVGQKTIQKTRDVVRLYTMKKSQRKK